jgi:hypothetical protein
VIIEEKKNVEEQIQKYMILLLLSYVLKLYKLCCVITAELKYETRNIYHDL